MNVRSQLILGMHKKEKRRRWHIGFEWMGNQITKSRNSRVEEVQPSDDRPASEEAHLANNILVSQFKGHETMADANKGFFNGVGDMATIRCTFPTLLIVKWWKAY